MTCNPLAGLVLETLPASPTYTPETVPSGTDTIEPAPIPGGYSNFEADCSIAFLWIFDGSVIANGSRVIGSNY